MEDLKLNEWYKVEGTNVIFYAKKYEEGILHAFGISFMGYWYEGLYDVKENNSIIKATKNDVKDLLISERYKRYSVGDKVKYLDTGVGKIEGRSVIYDDYVIYATDHPEKKDILFKYGKWAEVIKTVYLPKKQAEEMITEIKNDGNEYKIMNSIMDYRYTTRKRSLD